MRLSTVILLSLVTLICACNKKGSKEQIENTIFTPSKKLTNKYAKGFTISIDNQQISIQLFSPFQDVEDTLTFHVMSENHDPSQNRKSNYIAGPVNAAVLMASTHSAFLEKLIQIDIVKAISSKNYFFNSAIQRGVENDSIAEVGFAQNLNYERILLIHPQIIIISSMSSTDINHFANLIDAGIVLFPAAEWQEEHPLGRAEWIKVFGALTGQLQKSIDIFDGIEANYKKLRAKTEGIGSQPKVIVNAPYKDTWWLPGGKSYMSHLLKDAGADYYWKDDPNTGGIQADLESVYYQAHNADFWINPGTVKSMKGLLNLDDRYAEFKSVQTGRVYNNTLRTNELGGNDYYEAGVVNPDVVLADMIKIFHPEVMNNHNFYFYEKLN